MKIKKILLGCTCCFFIVLFIAVFVLGYFGLIPSLAHLLGTDKPRDLGIRYTEQNYNDGIKKLGVKIEMVSAVEASVSEAITFIGKHLVKETFSSEEITALTNSHTWGLFPVRETQIRINSDNTFEVSGLLKIDLAIEYIKKLGVSEADIKQAMSLVKIPMQDLPFYVKATGSVANNQVAAQFLILEIGRFSVPLSIVTPYMAALNDLFSKSLAQEVGATITSLVLKDGKMLLDGLYPSVIKITQR